MPITKTITEQHTRTVTLMTLQESNARITEGRRKGMNAQLRKLIESHTRLAANDHLHEEIAEVAEAWRAGSALPQTPTLKLLIDRFPSADVIADLMPDNCELGHRVYSITATDKEILDARREMAALPQAAPTPQTGSDTCTECGFDLKRPAQDAKEKRP
jgi:hypothetical protein